MRIAQNSVISLVVVLLMNAANAAQLPGPLVDTKWLAKHSNDVLVLDVRSDVKSFTKKPPPVKGDKKKIKKKRIKVFGHIPGAILVNYKKVRAKRTINGKVVDKMLPEKKDFEKLMQQSGVNNDSAIVIVTKGKSNLDMTMGTRVYWQLKYFGHDNVALLNGGTAQWIADKRPVSYDPSKATTGKWQARTERKDMLATSEDVAKAVKNKSALLVDNRSTGQYLGVWKKSYVYAKGHIPGAKSFPNELMTEGSAPAKFLPIDQLRQLSKQLKVDTKGSAITYCNSGHLASGGWFIMSELFGNKNVKLYDGSMHEWTLEKRPVTTLKME